MNIYTIQDKIAKYFMQPYYARNNGEALRSFENAIRDSSNPNNLLAKDPTGFALYHLGSYDDSTGVITPINPDLIGHGSDYIPQQ